MELDQLTMAMHLHISTTALPVGQSLPLSHHESLSSWLVQTYTLSKPVLAAITVGQ